MHRNREENLRFQIAFTETNIRWLLGELMVDRSLISRHKQSIREAEAELAQLRAAGHPFTPTNSTKQKAKP